MDLRKLKSIIEIFEKSNVCEMEISEGEEKVRLVKDSGSSPCAPVSVTRMGSVEQSSTLRPGVAAPGSHPDRMSASQMEHAQQAGQASPSRKKAQERDSSLPGDSSPEPSLYLSEDTVHTEIKSPMVGTFYSASAPDKDPYVTVGSTVEEGDVLCIIEAMKLMNEIKSTVTGEVVAIKAGNSEPIGYGDVLMVIGVR